MITQIRHTGLVVADLNNALSFWRDLLGLRVIKRMDESGPHIDAMMGLENVHVTTVKLAAYDGNLIELLHFHSHPDEPVWKGTPYSTGLTHIALTVDNLDSVYEMLVEAGIIFYASPQQSPNGCAKVIYCRAPEGVLLELVEVLKK